MKTEQRQSLPVIGTTKKLNTIINSPHLPVLVGSLSARSLSDLVEHLGVENSHSIVEYASDEQIKGMLDIQLWQHEPGKHDTLKIDDFFPWLEVWNDVGASFVCRKLEALGEEFVAVCFMKHLVVADTTIIGVSSLGHDFGRFDVIPKGGIDEIQDETIWYVLLDTLHHLHSHSPDFLEAVFTRASFVRSILREDVSEHWVFEEINQDLGQERDARGEDSGYISAIDAFGFLSISKTSSIEEVKVCLQYDQLTRRYFRIAKPDLEEVAHASDNASADAGTKTSVKNRLQSTDARQEETEQLIVLKELLTDLGINSKRGTKKLLLGSGDATGNSLTNLLDQALLLLRRESETLFEKRRDEILYLANVLVAGVGLRGLPFTELNAVKAVRATCNLGLDYLLSHDGIDSSELHFEFLSPEPGLMRVFHIGYRLLHQVPVNCAQSLETFLIGKDLKRRLSRLAWLQSELDDIMRGDQFLQKVENGHFEEVKRDIELLSLVLDHVAVFCFEHLLDGFPMFPQIISMQPQPIRIDRSVRFISSIEDLDAIQCYVDQIQIDL